MKRILLSLLCMPLILGASSCSDDPTIDQDTKTPPPANIGTKEEPLSVKNLFDVIGQDGVWVEGYVVGADEDASARSVPQAACKSNILLSSKADEMDRPNCVRLELTDGSDIQARLNTSDHPGLLGKKVKVQGNVRYTGGSLRITDITSQEGGKDPITDPEEPENPDPEEPEEPEPPVVGTVELDKLYGYGQATTGGQGATAANTHHFDDGKKFCAWLQLREKNKDTTPAIVWLSGKFTKDDGRAPSSPWFDIKRTQNISIYGTNDFVMENVGFFLNEARNIVIRNIYIKMPKADNGADGISMQESENVWVDHCTFESVNQVKDYEDGSCDITHATRQVTVSWCHFIKTQKSCLVGHSNSASADVAITATFHHNFFDLSSSRHPRVRFGKAHVYNNFFNQVSTYGVGSAYGAMVLVEDNSFDGVTLPTDICTYPAKPSGGSWESNLQGSVAGFLYERGNIFANRPSNARDPYPFTNVEYKAYNGEKISKPYVYEDFKPSYNYIVDKAEDVATVVPSGAGTKKLPGYASAPIPVNNGGISGPTDPDPGTDPDPEEPGGSEIGNGWTALSNGAAAASASTSGNTLTLTAMGKFESGKQVFGIVYREVTGNFTLTMQVDSYESPGTGNQSLAGLILTPDPAATELNFLHAMAAAGPASTFYYSNRIAAANAGKGSMSAPASTTGAKPILKLERAGEKCSASYSLDAGATFGTSKDVTIAGLADKLFIGVALNSGNTTKTATGQFSNFTLNGTTIPFAED